VKEIKPSSGEMEAARGVTRSALLGCEEVLRKGVEYEVWLGYGGRCSAEALEEDLIRVEFGAENKELEGVAAAAYYRSWFLESVAPDFQWQELLRVGGGLCFAEQVVDREPDVEELEGRDPPVEALGNPVERPGDSLARHGYSLSYHLVTRLLRLHGLEVLPELKRQDVEDAVEAALS